MFRRTTGVLNVDLFKSSSLSDLKNCQAMRSDSDQLFLNYSRPNEILLNFTSCWGRFDAALCER